MKMNGKSVLKILVILLILSACVFYSNSRSQTLVVSNVGRTAAAVDSDVEVHSESEISYEDIIKGSSNNSDQLLPQDVRSKLEHVILEIDGINSVTISMNETDRGAHSILVELSLSDGKHLEETELSAIKKIITNVIMNIVIDDIDIQCSTDNEPSS